MTVLPYATGLARVSRTLVPETATDVTFRAEELTWTEKADIGGTIFASERLYVITMTEGAVFSMAELWYTGTAGGAASLLVTDLAENEATLPPADV